MAYIEFKNIDKYFGENHVLKGISMSIEKGQFVTLLGPSGCGKSTLLRCLAGLESIDGGNIFLDGEDITKKEPKDRNIGMVFQHYSLFPNMTVLSNVEYALKRRKETAKTARETALHVLEQLGMHEHFLPLELGSHNQEELRLLPPVLHDLYEEYPLLRPNIRLIPLPSLMNMLENNQLDAALGLRENRKKSSLYYKITNYIFS